MVREDEQPERQPGAAANRRGDEESQSSGVAVLGQPLGGIRRNHDVIEGAVQWKALDDAPPFPANANASRHLLGMVEHGKKRDGRLEYALG
jgi:hypothetical protein